MNFVSAIMPTRGRPVLSAIALNSFLAQTYPHKQLVILDDAEDPSFRQPPEFKGVAYLRLDDRRTIAAKRNMGCAAAHGEILMHFDSDDWSAPDRMQDQVSRLGLTGKEVTGFHTMLFYDSPTGRCFRYSNDSSYALGTSLAYTRQWWASNRFDESKEIGEDNQFVMVARKADQLASVNAGQLMVARMHTGNTSLKKVDNNQFHIVAADLIPAGFFL